MKLVIANATIVLLCYACGIGNFAKGVGADSQKRLISAKKTIAVLSFSGVIANKMILKRKDCPYLITCKIYNINRDVLANNTSSLPYYTFNSPALDTVALSISEGAYSHLAQGDSVIKLSNTNFLRHGKDSHEIFSEIKNEWN